MPPSLSTARIFTYHFLTLGLYFFAWCNRLGNQLSQALRRKAVPTLWWFLVPGGSYYWIWQMGASLETATGRRLRSADTFLLYVLLVNAPFGSLSAFHHFPDSWSHSSHTTEVTPHLLLLIIGIVIAVLLFYSIVAHALYAAIIEKKIKRIREGTISGLPKQR